MYRTKVGKGVDLLPVDKEGMNELDLYQQGTANHR